MKLALAIVLVGLTAAALNYVTGGAADEVPPSIDDAPKPKGGETGVRASPEEALARAVKESDEFSRWPEQLSAAAAQLVRQGKCTPSDFVEYGGFTLAETSSKKQVRYFIHCREGCLARFKRSSDNARCRHYVSIAPRTGKWRLHEGDWLR